MAEKLKHFFNEDIICGIARALRAAYPRLDSRSFVESSLQGLEKLELLQRGQHIAQVMRAHLPKDYGEAIQRIVKSLGPELEGTDSFGMAPFRYLPHVLFVAHYGLEHFELSMRAQYELTKRFSAEGSIRPFLMKYPKETYARLLEWTSDANVHVRRLTSEGTRPRLPWAPRLPAFQKDPRPVLELLERLKDDPELYVRRSVANNLNDIGKDHPNVLVDTCRRWSKGVTENRKWIIRHALRSLVKRAHPGALDVLGFAGKPVVRIENMHLSTNRVRMGDAVGFSFDVINVAKTRQAVLVDFIVHFIKANGTSSPKVFKLGKAELSFREQRSFDGRVSFAKMTTRKHYPGVHRLEALINGVTFPLGTFNVLR